MRREILKYLERNSKINLQELAVLLGSDEVMIANESRADGEREDHLWLPYADRLGEDR